MITGGQAVVQALEQETDVAFGYPGGAILPVYQALQASSLRHILVRHEQAAAHAASGYARVMGRPGVCLATSGPGATNLITGLAAAYMDSIPLVAITGQVASAFIGRDAFQEVDITGATSSICKHNYLVRDVLDIPRVLKEAFHIAATGRPGPVLVDIPQDVLEAEMPAFAYPETVDLSGYKPTYRGHPLMIRRMRAAISTAQRPVICAGGGVISANATDALLQLAEAIQAPVVHSLMGIGAFPPGHPLSLGMIGLYGVPAANQAVQQADLLLVLGMRLGDRALGRGQAIHQDAVVIHVDIDPAEIGKNVVTTLPIVGDIGQVLAELCKQPVTRTTHGVSTTVPQHPQTQPDSLPFAMLDAMNAFLGNAVVVTDVGLHQIWAAQHLQIACPRRFLTSGGLGAMGYGLPAAIGAALGTSQQVLLVIGDGGLQMSLSELGTLIQEQAPVKILLMNNGMLGMIRELQQNDGQANRQVALVNPDYQTLCVAFGIPAWRVADMTDMQQALNAWWTQPGPALLECVIQEGIS